MKIKQLVLIGVFLMSGMVFWSYLHQPTRSGSQLSDNTVRYVNGKLSSIIKKDPSTLLFLNDIIESSHFLKKYKKAFLSKYYSQSTIEIGEYELLLKLYWVTQRNNIQALQSTLPKADTTAFSYPFKSNLTGIR